METARRSSPAAAPGSRKPKPANASKMVFRLSACRRGNRGRAAAAVGRGAAAPVPIALLESSRRGNYAAASASMVGSGSGACRPQRFNNQPVPADRAGAPPGCTHQCVRWLGGQYYRCQKRDELGAEPNRSRSRKTAIQLAPHAAFILPVHPVGPDYKPTELNCIETRRHSQAHQQPCGSHNHGRFCGRPLPEARVARRRQPDHPAGTVGVSRGAVRHLGVRRRLLPAPASGRRRLAAIHQRGAGRDLGHLPPDLLQHTGGGVRGWRGCADPGPTRGPQCIERKGGCCAAGVGAVAVVVCSAAPRRCLHLGPSSSSFCPAAQPTASSRHPAPLIPAPVPGTNCRRRALCP